MTELNELLLRQLLEDARELTEPTETNVEYVRGQAELICDFIGIDMDDKTLLMDTISHGITVPMVIDELKDRHHWL